MTLTVERELTINGGKIRRLPLLAGAALPVRGALLSWDASGYVHALVAGEAFAGVCDQSARGGGFVDVVTGQFDLLSLAAIAGISLTDIAAGTQVYASDDATLTATSSGNTRIGAVAALDGVRVVVSAATINAAKAASIPVVIPPSDGSLFGPNTLVVSDEGDDALGAASPYAAEFLTIQAAITAATSGDVVIVRPGTYAIPAGAPEAGVTLKSGVDLFGMPGANVRCPKAVFGDGGVAVDCKIVGHFKFIAIAAHTVLVRQETGSTILLECDEVDHSSSDEAVFYKVGATGAAPKLTVRVRGLLRGGGDIVKNNGNASSYCSIEADRILSDAGAVANFNAGGAPQVTVQAVQSITGLQLVLDTAGVGAARCSMKAPKIVGTDVGNPHFLLKSTDAGARYAIECPDLQASVDWQSSGELYLNGVKHTTLATALPALTLQGAGKAFIRGGETRGPTNVAAVWLAGTCQAHLLGGRFIGGNGNAAGVAIRYYSSGALLRLYQGAVLIGGDTAVNSVDVGGAFTPTALAMGDIAANLDKHADVTIDVGSLLVDAAVA